MRRRRLAARLRDEVHDVLEVRALGTDPGDLALLAWVVNYEQAQVQCGPLQAAFAYLPPTVVMYSGLSQVFHRSDCGSAE